MIFSLKSWEILNTEFDIPLTEFREIAEDLVQTAQKCPTTLRIVAHSMGGMYASRYLTEVENSPLVMSYKNADPPVSVEYMSQPLFSSGGVEEMTQVVKPGSRDEMKMHILSTGAVPLLHDLGTLSPGSIPGLMIPGIFQWMLISRGVVTSLMQFTDGALSDRYIGETMMIFIYEILSCQWEYTTILIPESSSSGVTPEREIKLIKNNPNATVYKLNIRTKKYEAIQAEVAGFVPTGYYPATVKKVVFPEGPTAQIPADPNDATAADITYTEFLGSHRQTLEIYEYPIIRTSDAFKGEGGNDLIFFKDKFLWWDFGIKYPANKVGTFPKIDPVHADYLDNSSPAYRKYLTRNLFYYMMFGFLDGKTPHTPTLLDSGAEDVEFFEAADAPVNYSPFLTRTITLQDQYGAEIVSFLPDTATVLPGETNELALTMPTDLVDAKYFLKIAVTDVNGNYSAEYLPFVKNALPPEITSPQAYDFIEGIVPLYGNVYDPKLDNGLGFNHYEVYCRLGEVGLPANFNNLNSWLDAGLQVPAYQADQTWPQNYGRFPVEGSQVLATLDTSALADGLLTVLVIAAEDNGYKIGTVRTFRVMQSGNSESITVAIDPAYKDMLTFTDFSGEPLLGIAYSLSHAPENPVDIYTYIRSAGGRIIKQAAYYNQQSIAMLGEPVIDPAEQGIFIYQTEDGLFHVSLQNSELPVPFLLTLSGSVPFSGITDAEGTPLDTTAMLFNENKTLLLSRTLAAGERYSLSFTTNGSFNATGSIDQALAPLYLGVQRKMDLSGSATLYPGGSYPQLSWDGKDEFGRYVSGGIYTAGIEVYGNVNGYAQDSCELEIATPFLFEISQVDNYDLQPGVLSFESTTVEIKINKGATLEVQVLDAPDLCQHTAEAGIPFLRRWGGCHESGYR